MAEPSAAGERAIEIGEAEIDQSARVIDELRHRITV